MKTDKLSNLIGMYILLGLVAAVVCGMFVVKPLFAQAGKSRQETKQVKAQIASLERLEKDTETLRQNYENVKAEHDRILALLPVKSEEERLLAFLNVRAQQSGVTLSAFAPAVGSSASTSSLSIYPVSINVSGSYKGIQDFLQKVEGGARFINFTAGSFAAPQNSSLAVKLDLNAYYQQSKEVTP